MKANCTMRLSKSYGNAPTEINTSIFRPVAPTSGPGAPVILPELMALSIDPGIRGTGIAVWDWSLAHRSTLELPAACFNLMPVSDSDWDVRADHMIGTFHEICKLLQGAILNPPWIITHAAIEYPEFRDEAAGHMTARRGDLSKLTFIAGAFYGVLKTFQVDIKRVTPRTWKGMLPKAVVERRIRELFNPLDLARLKPTTHSWDAIGLGLHWKGVKI